jgi:hypothetical protein
MVTFLWVISGFRAEAADRADVERGELVITGDGWKIEVLGRGMPLIENISDGGACRVTFTGKGAALTSQVKECPDALRDEVVPASKYWLFETEGDLAGVAFDVWYLVDGRGVTTHVGPTSLEVKGGELPLWELAPTKVTLPQWPVGQDLPAACRITIATDSQTGVATGVTVQDEGCPSGYGAAVVSAANTWEFTPISTNGVAVPLVFDATVRFSPPSDGAPATIDVDLPVAPEVELAVLGAMPERKRLPTTPPLFRLHHKNYADVLVHEVGVLEAQAAPLPRECEFLMQVNTGGRVWLWPERCPTDLHASLEASRLSWSVVAGRPGAGELYARFRGTWELPAGGGAPTLRLPEGDLVGQPTLPPGVRSFAAAEPVLRVPPKMPGGYVLKEPVACFLDVTVGVRGRVTAVLPTAVADSELPGGCPAELLEPAKKSVTKWRWKPATSDGEAFESHAAVRVRFGGGGT